MAGTPSMVSASPERHGNTRMISSGGCVSLLIILDGSKSCQEVPARGQTSGAGGHQGSLPYGNGAMGIGSWT